MARGGSASDVRDAIQACIAGIHYRETSDPRDISWGSTGGRHRSDCQLEAFMAYDLLGAAGASPERGGIGHAMGFGTIGGEKILFSGDHGFTFTGSVESAASGECQRIYNNGAGRSFNVHVGSGEDLDAVSRTAYGR